MLSAKHLQLGHAVNSGRYGTVHTASYHGQPCAVKIVPKQRGDVALRNMLRILHNETTNWKTVSGASPYIVKLIDAFEDEDNAYFVQDYCDGGPLIRAIQNGNTCPETTAAKAMRHICHAVAACHELDVYHGDIKPANIVHETANDSYKLCDFGCSQRTMFDHSGCFSKLGTLCYVAPEVRIDTSYGKIADVWSIGATAYVLCTGACPAPSTSAAFLTDHSTSLSPECVDFLRVTLQLDPTRRPSAKACLDHPFLAA